MNYLEIQAFFKKLFPDKKITFEFDDYCYGKIEVGFTDGKPNDENHIECGKVKASIENMRPIHVDIIPYRQVVSLEYVRECLNRKL